MRRILLAIVVGACTRAPSATSEFWGPRIEPPRGLAQLAPGMSVAEAKRLVPGLHAPQRPGVYNELVLDSGTRDIKLTVRADAGTVSSIVAIVEGQRARAQLTRAWGEPQITRDALGQPEVTWASEATGWKVKLDCIERNCLVEYLRYHPLTTELFGPHVVPPGDLARLRIGMPVAEAGAIAPGPVAVRSGLPMAFDGVREFVAIDDKLGIVSSLYLNVPAQAADVIAAAWGPGASATWPINKPVTVWADPTTRWRAVLRPALGNTRDLVFDHFMPAADLLGAQPDTLDGLPTPVLGRSLDEVKRAYGSQLSTRGRSVELALPATEWGRGATHVALETSGHRVRELRFALPYKPYPPARDELRTLFVAKWGPPHDAIGATLVFREADPRVEIRDDAERGEWQLAIR